MSCASSDKPTSLNHEQKLHNVHVAYLALKMYVMSE